MKQDLNPAVRKVLKRLHYPLDVILLCVRWYVAYPLSLRHLEQMMAERGISVDHSTVHRWALKLLPVLEKAFRRCKRAVGRSPIVTRLRPGVTSKRRSPRTANRRP